jgi:hypothetical protein
MISGAGIWLLVMVIFLDSTVGVSVAKRYPTVEECHADAAVMALSAGAAGAEAVEYKCTDLRGRDPAEVAEQVSQEVLVNRLGGDESPVPGY